MINIEVVYCGKYKQIVKLLKVADGCTALDAIRISEIQKDFMEIDLEAEDLKIGIFSKPVPFDRILKENDRVEIYRQLYQTPMQARIMNIHKK